MDIYDIADKLAGLKVFDYKTVDTRTLKGLKQAERLQAQGWKIISTGLFTIQFQKERTPKKESN